MQRLPTADILARPGCCEQRLHPCATIDRILQSVAHKIAGFPIIFGIPEHRQRNQKNHRQYKTGCSLPPWSIPDGGIAQNEQAGKSDQHQSQRVRHNSQRCICAGKHSAAQHRAASIQAQRTQQHQVAQHRHHAETIPAQRANDIRDPGNIQRQAYRGHAPPPRSHGESRAEHCKTEIKYRELLAQAWQKIEGWKARVGASQQQSVRKIGFVYKRMRMHDNNVAYFAKEARHRFHGWHGREFFCTRQIYVEIMG
ncbi:hypothetical protein D3C71_837510 [compost metagenome]